MGSSPAYFPVIIYGLCKPRLNLKSAQNKHPGPGQHMRRYELMRSTMVFPKDQEEVNLINQLHCPTYYTSPTGVDRLISEKHTTPHFYKQSPGQHICTSTCEVWCGEGSRISVLTQALGQVPPSMVQVHSRHESPGFRRVSVKKS